MKNSAILDIDNPINADSDTSVNELHFQDFSRTTANPNVLPIFPASQFSSSVGDFNDETSSSDLLIGENKSAKPAPAFWELAYFAKYFNITTRDVVTRIIWSVVPVKSPNGATYIERHIQTNPDIYGPFWINTTLIFSIAIFANIANYLSSGGDSATWCNDWNKLGIINIKCN